MSERFPTILEDMWDPYGNIRVQMVLANQGHFLCSMKSSIIAFVMSLTFQSPQLGFTSTFESSCFFSNGGSSACPPHGVFTQGFRNPLPGLIKSHCREAENLLKL